MQDESAMLAYATLAEISQRKQQFPQRDKFLLLTGITACRAGWLEIAARCRALVLDNNPVHLVRRFDSLPDALRSSEFDSFYKQLLRFCPYEKAEHLLSLAGAEPFSEKAKSNSGDFVQALLDSPLWKVKPDGGE